ncbi:alpha/beta fold hydrolase [Promicromonospora kroppenstedtii]|uniref:alpha/beta fold hydrolase n=1 Tax=Promicromonospora kroppenstedtii TaxID=440482 RepID=UPI0004BBCB98|nr:alpha/beta hydrolase [Promicromonospora kroppenstedtii]
MTTPTVVLVHGAFAESSSWNAVVGHLQQQMIPVVAAGNPLRSVAGDAQYVRDVVASIPGPVVLAGHSYGGMVITEAAAANPKVVGLVYVAAFTPDTGENAFDLSAKFPGSTLGGALKAYPVSTGGNELAIRPEVFGEQFAADVDADLADLMAATQRPVTEAALTDGLPAAVPAWRTLPSWVVYGESDRNIPAELVRFMAERAGARVVTEVPGASHAVAVSHPVTVAETIIAAVRATSD